MPEPDLKLMRLLAQRGKLARGGGGSDDGGDMLEARVAALESDVREIKVILVRIEARLDKMDSRLDKIEERVRKLEIDVSGMTNRLALMPSTWTIMTICIASIVGSMIGVTGLILTIMRFTGRA